MLFFSALRAKPTFLPYGISRVDIPKSSPSISDFVANPSPEMTASYPSQIVYAWFDGIIKKGWKNPITEEDLHDINPDYSCRNVMKTWNRHWQNQAEKKKPKGEKMSILPTLILTFAIPFMEAGVNRVFSILCQQVRLPNTYPRYRLSYLLIYVLGMNYC